jgi:hypothetical protein
LEENKFLIACNILSKFLQISSQFCNIILNAALRIMMKMQYQTKKQSFIVLAAALLLFAVTFSSCNAHQKAAKMIGKTVKEQMAKFVQNEEIVIPHEINQLEHLLPSPSVSDIMAEKTELIATY